MKNERGAIAVRVLIALLLAVQLVLFEVTLLSGDRFPVSGQARSAIGAAVCVIFASAIALLLGFDRRYRTLRWLTVALALGMTFRFYSPGIFERTMPPANWPQEKMVATVAPDAGKLLREIMAAEEQYRLTAGVYTSEESRLAPWLSEHRYGVSIDARGDTGFIARVSNGSVKCSLWVRDARLRDRTSSAEGSPTCGAEVRSRQQSIQTSLAPASKPVPFSRADAYGTWDQHRGDEHRTSLHAPSSSEPGHSWTARIGGPVRSSVAIAGNQVFIGSHTNGETVGLSLSSGTIGFRVRSPNWVHHEPVIAHDAVIFSFGNNEPSNIDPGYTGSAPSGVIAYDRVTGKQKWRRYARGSVMGSPVLWNDIVAVGSGGNEAIAWRASDGSQLWRVPLPGFSPMANPLLHDSLFIVGVEPATICAIEMRSGRKVYCSVLTAGNWGAGHASAAIAGDLVLQVYEEDRSGEESKVEGRAMKLVRRVVGLPPRRYRTGPHDALREQVMAAARISDGKPVWFTGLGPGRTSVPGHTAGTPAISGTTAFVPSPVNGEVVAIDARSGKKLWSSPVKPARGSVVVIGGWILAATRDTAFVVLDAATGRLKCRQSLPNPSDRAAITVAGATGILTLLDGTIMARPVSSWLGCKA